MNAKINRKRRKKIFFIVTGAILSFLIFVVSIMHLSGIPIWREIFKFCSVADFSSVADEYPMSVHVLDVGKADCIFITCENKNILIDAGEMDIFKIPNDYLKKCNIKKIDLLVLTHPHSDHVGCMSSVVSEFEIGSFLMPQINEEKMISFKAYDRLKSELIKKNITTISPTRELNIGPMRIDVLSPYRDFDDLNDNSIVLKITYKNKRFLFTGDAGQEAEEYMMNEKMDLGADVIKIAHHGSKTATSQEFLNCVRPNYAVISVGKDKNNLPKKSTLDKLKQNGITTYRTDLDGTVIFATDGENIKVFCEREYVI